MTLVNTIIEAAEDKIAKDIVKIDLDPGLALAENMVIMTGNARNHTQAIADEIADKLSKEGVEPIGIEGYRDGNWILMDFASVIVHIFTGDTREFYDLERLWNK